MTAAIRVTTRLGREAVAPSQTDSLHYALIGLEPASQPGVGMPLNVVLLIERSPAMDQEGRLSAVQQAFRPLVDQLGPLDTFSIVLVGDRPKVLLPADPELDKEKARRLLGFLDSHPVGDRPAWADALTAAHDELRKHAHQTRASRVILVAASPAPQEAEAARIAHVMAEHGIGFSAFGLGHQWPVGLLASAVDAGRGRLHHLLRPADLAAAARDELTHLRRQSLTSLKLYLRLAKGVRLRRLFQVAPTLAHWLPAQPTERDAVVRLGDMADDQPRCVLAELIVPPMNEGTYRLGTVDVAYEAVAPTHQALRSGPHELVVTVGAPGPEDRGVMRQVEAVSAFSLVERAIESRRNGDAARALQLLTNAARIADGGRLGEGLRGAIESLETTGTLPEIQSKALLVAARDGL